MMHMNFRKWHCCQDEFSTERQRSNVGGLSTAQAKTALVSNSAQPQETQMPDGKNNPEIMYGIQIERIHEKGQSTHYSAVLGLVGRGHQAQEGQMPDKA